MEDRDLCQSWMMKVPPIHVKSSFTLASIFCSQVSDGTIVQKNAL